jgi:hypothetical protein
MDKILKDKKPEGRWGIEDYRGQKLKMEKS